MRSILISFFVFGMYLMPFAQMEAEVTVASEKNFIKGVNEGAIVMVLPASVTKADVDKYSKYYTSFFSTSYDEGTRKITFNMVKNDGKSRRVIMRFLGANRIQFAKVGETSIPLANFYDDYLK